MRKCLLGLHQALEEREKEPKENRRVGFHIPFLTTLWASVSSLAGSTTVHRWGPLLLLKAPESLPGEATKGGTQLGRVQKLYFLLCRTSSLPYSILTTTPLGGVVRWLFGMKGHWRADPGYIGEELGLSPQTG